MAYGTLHQFVCPHCNQASRAVVIDMSKLWQRQVTTLACYQCEEPLDSDDLTNGLQPVAEDEEIVAKARDELTSYIGLASEKRSPGKKPRTNSQSCSRCLNFVRHIYDCRCLHHLKAIAPDDTCSDFEAAKA